MRSLKVTLLFLEKAHLHSSPTSVQPSQHSPRLFYRSLRPVPSAGQSFLVYFYSVDRRNSLVLIRRTLPAIQFPPQGSCFPPSAAGIDLRLSDFVRTSSFHISSTSTTLLNPRSLLPVLPYRHSICIVPYLQPHPIQPCLSKHPCPSRRRPSLPPQMLQR